jgi:hypothetical protein
MTMTLMLLLIGLNKGFPVAINFPSMAACEANKQYMIDAYKSLLVPFPIISVTAKCIELPIPKR